MNISAELSNHQQTVEENGGELTNEYAHNTNSDVNATERQTRNPTRTRYSADILRAFYIGLALLLLVYYTILLVCLLINESTT